MDKKPEAADPESVTILSTTDLETNEGKVILSNKINKEIDKIFGPAIQRNRSGSDIEIVGPFRRRHYWSQERLFADKPLHPNQVGDISNQGLSSFQIDELKSLDEAKNSQIPVLHESQRAEIVASVTERLYSKLKKNEKIIPKIESVLDRKSIQPLSELKICSNARQRLMELSQKALRNKRRIGIPAYTQTRNHVTRVKNQGIEIQSDLQTLVDSSQHNCYSLRKDASIQTESITPRLKEKAVGSKYDAIYYSYKDTATQTNVASYKDGTTMTHIVKISNHSTQTVSLQQNKRINNTSPPKKFPNKIDSSEPAYKDNNYLSPFININISPIYSHESGESSGSECFTEDDSESSEDNNSILVYDNNKETLEKITEYKSSSIHENEVVGNFSDDEGSVLPRIVVDSVRNIDIDDYEELILGQNKNTYPYNIKLSPCKSIDESKRVLKFQDNDSASNATRRNNDTNSKNLYNIMESHLKLPGVEYLNEQVPEKTEVIQESVVNVLPSNLENYEEMSSNCNDTEVNRRDEIEHDSLIRFENEFNGDETESDIPLYYSLNSFFKTRHKKRTPTEYLHYLIQKRREAVSMDNSRFYQRNISF